MAAYKNEERGTWYCKFYYTNWQGERKQKLKRGFKLQREAKDWERQFLEQFAKNPNITFRTLCKKYLDYNTPRVKEVTAITNKMLLEEHAIPYFGDMSISDITPEQINQWQTEKISFGYSSTYLRRMSSVTKAAFNYAVQYLGLAKNPYTTHMGSLKGKQIQFWTPEEYKSFINHCKKPRSYIIFEILYYTGMRVGELLALTFGDIDFEKHQITIDKTVHRINRQDVITAPKTANAHRCVDIPVFLEDELREYISHIYKPNPDARLFPITKEAIEKSMKSYAALSGVKRIRVHDLRHSHASTLIELGASPVLVSRRLGHASADITLRIYAHLFPTSQHEIVMKIKKVE